MSFIRLSFIVLLTSLSIAAFAQKPATPATATARMRNDTVRFWWLPVENATRYKIVAKAYRADNNKYVCALELANTADTTVFMKTEDYKRKLDEYNDTYRNRKKKCAKNPACRLRYEIALVATNDGRESEALPFRYLWH